MNEERLGEMIYELLDSPDPDDVEATFLDDETIALRVFEPGSDDYRDYRLILEEV